MIELPDVASQHLAAITNQQGNALSFMNGSLSAVISPRETGEVASKHGSSSHRNSFVWAWHNLAVCTATADCSFQNNCECSDKEQRITYCRLPIKSCVFVDAVVVVFVVAWLVGWLVGFVVVVVLVVLVVVVYLFVLFSFCFVCSFLVWFGVFGIYPFSYV